MSWSGKVVAALGCVALCLPASAGAATFSDSFAGRELVKGAPVEVMGSNVGASREAGEPVPKPISAAGHSVWVEWESDKSSYYTLSTCGSAIPTVLATYVGPAVDQLTEHDSGANPGGPECSGVRNGVTFLALNGAKVKILVDGNGFFLPPAAPPATEGPLSLRIEETPPPANDDFAAAEPVGGTVYEEPDGTRFYFSNTFGYNWNADKETGEPKHAGDSGGSSVWYSWTAPESGLARVSVCCSLAELLGVYAGDTLATLSGVRSGKGSVEVPVFAGTTYRIAVDSEFSFFLGGTFDGSFDLKVAMNLAPGPGLPSADPAGPPPPSPPPARDTTAPKTSIFKTSVRSKARAASFFFRSGEPGSSFRCKLDKRKATACTSPKAYSGLAPGAHHFKVYAVDAAGNADPTPATAGFAIAPPQHRHR